MRFACPVERVQAALLSLYDMLGTDFDNELLTDCLLHFDFDIARVTNWVIDHPGVCPV